MQSIHCERMFYYSSFHSCHTHYLSMSCLLYSRWISGCCSLQVISQFRDEELEHLDTGLDHDAEQDKILIYRYDFLHYNEKAAYDQILSSPFR